MSPATTSFTLPTTNNVAGEADAGQPVLQYGQTYAISVNLEQTDGSTVAGCALCNVNSESRSFFDYTPIDPVSIGLKASDVINLPTNVNPIPTTSGTVNKDVYTFHAPIVPDGFTYIDPIAADAFIYTIGAGDSNFKSVDPVTDVGTGTYLLYIWDGLEFVLLGSGARRRFRHSTLPKTAM